MACTDLTPEGFFFDMGGHVIFSHYLYFDQLIDAAIGSGDKTWNTLQRVSYVWIKDTWVAYPLQNNIAALPKDDQVHMLLKPCLAQLLLCTTATRAACEVACLQHSLDWCEPAVPLSFFWPYDAVWSANASDRVSH